MQHVQLLRLELLLQSSAEKTACTQHSPPPAGKCAKISPVNMNKAVSRKCSSAVAWPFQFLPENFCSKNLNLNCTHEEMVSPPPPSPGACIFHIRLQGSVWFADNGINKGLLLLHLLQCTLSHYVQALIKEDSGQINGQLCLG